MLAKKRSVCVCVCECARARVCRLSLVAYSRGVEVSTPEPGCCSLNPASGGPRGRVATRAHVAGNRYASIVTVHAQSAYVCARPCFEKRLSRGQGQLRTEPAANARSVIPSENPNKPPPDIMYVSCREGGDRPASSRRVLALCMGSPLPLQFLQKYRQILHVLGSDCFTNA